MLAKVCNLGKVFGECQETWGFGTPGDLTDLPYSIRPLEAEVFGLTYGRRALGLSRQRRYLI